jgi:hypothetical protein
LKAGIIVLLCDETNDRSMYSNDLRGKYLLGISFLT